MLMVNAKYTEYHSWPDQIDQENCGRKPKANGGHIP